MPIHSVLAIYLGVEKIDSISHGFYQFCLPFLYQVHKNESRLIKIKWSKLTSYFPLHLWSICFQIYSACSNFSGLTLVQFTLLQCQTQKQATLFRRLLSLCCERPDFPSSPFAGRISSLHFFFFFHWQNTSKQLPILLFLLPIFY